MRPSSCMSTVGAEIFDCTAERLAAASRICPSSPWFASEIANLKIATLVPSFRSLSLHCNMSVSGESREIDTLGLGSVAAIGNFDGVHRGHQSMVATLRSRADELDVPAVAVTFDPPPIEILRPEVAPPRLMTLRRRMHFLRIAGADHVVVLRTDRELLSLSAEQFFDEVLLQGLRIRGLVEGPNFRFGKGREGDAALLRTLCERNEIPLSIIEPTRYDGQMVSSSLIRRCVGAGDLRNAMLLLGRPHEVIGIVERGAGAGRHSAFQPPISQALRRCSRLMVCTRRGRP